jgi:hypothetical protein
MVALLLLSAVVAGIAFLSFQLTLEARRAIRQAVPG